MSEQENLQEAHQDDVPELNMATKDGKIEFLVQHIGEDMREELEAMNIAELSKQVKAIKQAVARQQEQHAAHPGLVRPGGDPVEFESLRGNLQVGQVELEDGSTVAIDEIIAYRGRDLHPATGAHQIAIINPKNDFPGIVTFEKRPKLFEREPVAIVRDWRVKAQVLYVPQVVVTNPTLGTQTVRAHARGDYYLPLDVSPDKQMVSRMVDYVKGTINIVDEEEELARKIAGELIPEAGPIIGGR